MTLVACRSADPDFEALLADYAGPDRPGAAVLVIKDGERVMERTLGLADISSNEPITSSTNFRLASITKQFTAMAILLLVDANLLTLETTLGEVFPASGEAVASITVRQLLQHQSGLPDYEPLVPEHGAQVLDQDVLALMLAADSLEFAPGTEYSYSNSGYAVLAMIVETISGATFAEFLDQRIFDPLGMDATVAFENGVSTVFDRAFGYTVEDSNVEFADQSAYSAVLGDGGIYSSLDDLFVWDRSLYRDDLISPELKTAMWTPSLENYGFGWRIDTWHGHLRHHHSGSTSGFRNVILRFPDERLTVIVLTNRAGPDVRPLAERLAEKLPRQMNDNARNPTLAIAAAIKA